MSDVALSQPARSCIVALLISVSLICIVARVATTATTLNNDQKPIEGLIVEPDIVTAGHVASWKRDGFQAIVLVLDERFDQAAYQGAVDAAAAHSLDLYFWIEVGRNPTFAQEHPEWMASFGSHDDWRRLFPDVRLVRDGEVAKVWPWTPIAYREAFAAHLTRIKKLLERVPPGYRGLLLNDLQGGPSSCGCGNLQCRWAVDYGVPTTAETLVGHDVAANFLAEVRKLTADKKVIPVWTTECEEHDLAAEKRPDRGWTTGYCGSVDCFDYCRERFDEQWNALHATHPGPTAVLALHKELQRDRNEYGAIANWIASAADYINNSADRKPMSRPPLWLIVQGYNVSAEEEAAARGSAAGTGAAVVLVARARIDQSFAPRIVAVEGK